MKNKSLLHRMTPRRCLPMGLVSLLALGACSTANYNAAYPESGYETDTRAPRRATPDMPGLSRRDVYGEPPRVEAVRPPRAPAAAAPSAPALSPSSPEMAAPAQNTSEADPAVLTPFDPLEPDAKLNTTDRTVHADLWRRVRDGFGMPDLENASVKEWERFYATRPDYVSRMTARGARYLFHITEEVQKRHMPTELALLPFTESAFNPQAMSVAQASGMWQFIPATGRDYDLKQNIFRDDRRDVLASTRAALDYLQRLYTMFGDWHLALAAYNCGEGTVQRAVQRNQKAGLPIDYQSLNLPAETRGYVPKLQAVKNIVQRPDNFGLKLPPLQNHPYFLSVPIGRDMDVDVAARLAGISIEEFKMLNPQLNKPVILAAGTPQILLPYDIADDFVRAVKNHRGPLASWTAWVANKTLRPSEAARLVGMSEAQLCNVNRIPARMLVKSGSTLLVQRTTENSRDVSAQVADSAAMSLAPDLPPTRRVNVRVQRGGESVASLARRWHLTATQVASWNHLSPTGKFGPGAVAVLFLPRSRSAVAQASEETVERNTSTSTRRVSAQKVSTTAALKGGGVPSRTEKTKVRIAEH